ncbi:MAG: hypothetical protein HY033_04905 [Ignavibacteriae bacterium]|nr:hypothetical protein [Ignavibacteria bacterium]MBI3364229.1 hypothetical protein [Ignavibacteriota bacterium]
MKNVRTYLFFCLLLSAIVARADIKIVNAKGDVAVRHNVQEEWTTLSKGDIVHAEDAVKTGNKSSIVLLVDGAKKIVVPALVVLDLSDIRSLTQEELLLKLAMEDMRAIPQDTKHENDLNIPRTTTIHGASREAYNEARAVDPALSTLQLNGIKVLYNNSFYATCVLRAKQIFRRNPSLVGRIDDRMMVASGLEKMNLRSEALDEYRSIQKEKLTPNQKVVVGSKIKQLQKKM